MDMTKEEYVVREIKEISSLMNEDTKSIRLETTKLAKEFENTFNNPPFPIRIDDMDQRYVKRNQMYYLNDFQSEEGYKQIVATGAVPVDDKIKTKLVMIEYLYPKLSEAYRKFKLVDEVWYLDRQSVAGGNTEKNIMSQTVPGFDLGGEYERGEKPYSRFGIVDPEKNPERKTIWSPDVFIELFDEFIISAQAPVYVKNEFTGKVSIHYNLIHLRENTIEKSQSNIIIISNQFTLIGMSPGAKNITNFTQYEKRSWDSKTAKIEYFNSKLKLEKIDKEFTNKIKTLTPGNFCECEFLGKKYGIYKEMVPEIGFHVVALI